jgi:uncharacterized membrane protein YvbJ
LGGCATSATIQRHDKKKVLLCELKNSKDNATISSAKKQLDHSKHIVNVWVETSPYRFFYNMEIFWEMV